MILAEPGLTAALTDPGEAVVGELRSGGPEARDWLQAGAASAMHSPSVVSPGAQEQLQRLG